MAITPLLVEQIEKFQCIESSTAPKLSVGIFRCHVARVTCPQTWLKVSDFEGYLQIKLQMKDFKNHFFLVLGLVLIDFHHKIQCAIFFVEPIEFRQCDFHLSVKIPHSIKLNLHLCLETLFLDLLLLLYSQFEETLPHLQVDSFSHHFLLVCWHWI